MTKLGKEKSRQPQAEEKYSQTKRIHTNREKYTQTGRNIH